MKKLSKKAQKFEIYMRENWDTAYYDLAGCKYISSEKLDKEEFKEELLDTFDMYEEEIEFAFYDEHCKDEIYVGCYEEGPIVYKVKTKRLNNYIEKNYYTNVPDWKPSKKITKKIDGKELIERYGWVTLMFRWIDDINAINPNSYVGPEVYEEEKELLKEDPYLAMYWLIKFGFCADEKYNELTKIIAENQLETVLPFISNILAFFKETDNYYEIKIPNHLEKMSAIYKGTEAKPYMDGLYLKRRAFIIFITQSYNTIEGNINNIVDSFLIYPKVEESLFSRIYWLIAFALNHFELHDDLEELCFKKLPKDFLFIKELIYFYKETTPNNEKPKIVTNFFNFLMKNKEICTIDTYYVQLLILQLGLVEYAEKKQLKKITNSYFEKNTENYKILKSSIKK